MRIYLIGMPGCGKSHWMRKLAHHLQYEGLDLDTYIESVEHRSIAELFDIGEPYFRKKEMLALRNTLNELPENSIVATGGGVPLFHNNMEWMKEHGRVIYLQADVMYLYNNLINAYVERPLLQSQSEEGVLKKLTDLYELRKETYQQAHHIVDMKSVSVSTFTKILGL